MRSRKALLAKSRLYLILDKKAAGDTSLGEIAKEIAHAGIDLVQLRDKKSKKEAILKDAFAVRSVLQGTSVLFIVNDYPDIAKRVNSDGVHVGCFDVSLENARRILGKNKIIGVSCKTPAQALDAQKRGADYIGFGPVFASATKPEEPPIGLRALQELRGKIKIPVFAIGNINRNNLGALLSLGVKRIALCRAILKSKDRAKAARYFCKKLH